MKFVVSEVKGGSFCMQQARHFLSMMETCNMVDLGAFDSKFTWFRNPATRCFISKRLDRGLGDVCWHHTFLEAVVENFPRVHFDHCPLLLL